MTQTTIRHTTTGDLPAVMALYDEAKSFMRRSGNMTQWTGGYPGEDIILEDISRRYSYVCIAEDSIAGVFSLIPGDDPTYAVIYDGKWQNEFPYATIHRLAVGGRGRGLGGLCIDWSFNKFSNLRADTHRDNLPMQGLLLKNGFKYCGIIYVSDGTERLAYQKTAP